MERTRFKGFPSGLFEFLSELSVNNNKEWFDTHRQRYKSQILNLTKFFVAELGPILALLNKDFDIEPRVGRTISRINNDSRFNKNRPPYRPFIQISFSRLGSRWLTEASLFVSLQSQGIVIGFYPGDYSAHRFGYVQQGIKRNTRLFQRYLDEQHIAQSYSELTDGEEGSIIRWPLPETARRWVKLESFTVGEFFPASDVVLARNSFLDRARQAMIDLYPLWLFATSEDIPAELGLYWENAALLTRPLAKMAS